MRGGQLKIETNGHYLTPENCERLKQLGVKAVSVLTAHRRRPSAACACVASSTGRWRACATCGCRRADRNQFLTGKLQRHEAEQIVDLAYELGAASFYSGRTMFTGNAARPASSCAVG